MKTLLAHLFKQKTWNKKYILLPLLLFVWSCDSQNNQGASPSPDASIGQKSPLPPETAMPSPSAEDWHMFMYDLDFSGRSPDKTLIPPLKLLWKFKTGGPLHASPVVTNGTLYIGSTDGKLYALDAKKWDIKWFFDAQSSIRNSASVLGKYVYVNTRDNRCYALNADTGEKVWEFKSKGWMDSAPIVADGNVYIGAFPSKIYQLNARTGTVEKMRERTIRIRGIEYGCANGEFRPIAPLHSAKMWREATAGSDSYPVTVNGFVYIGARNGQIHAFDEASKREIWGYQLAGFIDTAPAISDGILYVASGDGAVYAFGNATSETPSEEYVNGHHQVKATRNQGIVVHDNAPVFAEKNDAQQNNNPFLHLNDGVVLPIVQTEDDAYQLELPNGKRGWMDKFTFGQFEDTAGISFNTNFCGKRRTLQLIEGAEFPRWSPNGEFIAMLKRTDLRGRYWHASELLIMDKEAKQARKFNVGQSIGVPNQPIPRVYNPYLSWSLDSRLLAYEADEAGERNIYTVNWKLGHIKKLIQGEAPSWAPTSNRLVFRRREKGLDVVCRINSDASGLQTIARVPFERRQRADSYLLPPSWAPDGTRIAFRVNTSKYVAIRIQDVEGRRLKEIQTQHQHVAQIHWAADGRHLAYVLSGSNRLEQFIDKQLHLADATSTPTRSQILLHTSPAWAPDGKRLAYLEREDCEGLRWKVWVYDLESGRKFPIARTQQKITSVVWMPDGNQLCLWQTSSYFRDNAYKPAITKGWVVPLSMP